MNRLQFFQEMKKGLMDTVKEMTYPTIVDEVDRIEGVIDHATGVEWIELGNYDSSIPNKRWEIYKNGYTFIIFYKDQTLWSINPICSKCGTVINWISYENAWKCFSCDSKFEFDNKEQLQSMRLPTKKVDGVWYVSVHKNK